jgi:hypothetical protein
MIRKKSQAKSQQTKRQLREAKEKEIAKTYHPQSAGTVKDRTTRAIRILIMAIITQETNVKMKTHVVNKSVKRSMNAPHHVNQAATAVNVVIALLRKMLQSFLTRPVTLKTK